MIFYETVIIRRNKGLTYNIPFVYGSEQEARLAFNTAKKSMKKSGIEGDRCAYYRCVATTDLTKQDWMKLFLGDHQGSHNCKSESMMFVRDLITVHECLGEYSYE